MQYVYRYPGIGTVRGQWSIVTRKPIANKKKKRNKKIYQVYDRVSTLARVYVDIPHSIYIIYNVYNIYTRYINLQYIIIIILYRRL